MSGHSLLNYLNSLFIQASSQASRSRRTRSRSTQQRYRELCCESLSELLDAINREVPGLGREKFPWADTLPRLSDPGQFSRKEYLKEVQDIIDDSAERLHFLARVAEPVQQAS